MMCVCRWAPGRWRSCVCVWPLWTLRWSRRSRRSGSVTRPRGSPSWTPSRPKNDGSRTSERNLPRSSQQPEVPSLVFSAAASWRRLNVSHRCWRTPDDTAGCDWKKLTIFTDVKLLKKNKELIFVQDLIIVSVWFNITFPLFCLVETIWSLQELFWISGF